MLQKFSKVNIIDNSGAKTAKCIHVYGGYRQRYAKVGSLIKVTILKVRSIAKDKKIVIKKGQLYKAVITHIRNTCRSYSGNSLYFWKMSGVALISERKRFIGTKLVAPVIRTFRNTQYSRLLFLGGHIY